MATGTQTQQTTPASSVAPAQPAPVGGVRQPQARQFSWPLDDDTTAELRIVGTQISRDHLDTLIEYLEIAKKRLSERRRDDA